MCVLCAEWVHWYDRVGLAWLCGMSVVCVGVICATLCVHFIVCERPTNVSTIEDTETYTTLVPF